MFYVYTIVVPIIIACCLYALQRPNTKESAVNGGLILSLILFAYSCLLLLLDIFDILSTGWSSYTVVVFLVPIFAIFAVLKAIFYWKNRKKRHRRSDLIQ